MNPDPRHVVRLYGRAPETFDFRFRIGFIATNREDDCYKHAGFWEADLVVDRYLPGRCGWEIRGSAMIMVEPRCKPNHPRCSEERSRRLSNSDDSKPVQVKCKRVAPEKRGYGRTFFFCNRLPEHKSTHELRAHTRSIRIDLYDLDHEEVN